MNRFLGFAKRRRSVSPAQTRVRELQNAQLAAVYYNDRVGGDCCEFLRVSPNRVLFALLDVAGRAEQNRPVVAAVHSIFRSLGRELFPSEEVNEADAMITLCLELNRTILRTADRVCSTPTFAGCYNEHLGTVSYFNAGHTPGLLTDSGRAIELPATGLPLGLFSHATPDASIVALEPGDSMLLVSRGIVEAGHRGKEFGLEQVKGRLQRVQEGSAREICSAILEELREFTRKPDAENDVTVVALSRQRAAKAQVVGA